MPCRSRTAWWRSSSSNAPAESILDQEPCRTNGCRGTGRDHGRPRFNVHLAGRSSGGAAMSALPMGLLAFALAVGAAAEEPPWKRTLQGDDARKAAELEKRLDELETA